MIRLIVACTVFLCATVSAGVGPPTVPLQGGDAPCVSSGQLTVEYLGNEGVMVTDGCDGVLVDALFGEGITGYPVVPKAMRRQLESGEGSAAGVRLSLATHHHGDHFAPDAVDRFLHAAPAAEFVSTPQAVGRLPGVWARPFDKPTDKPADKSVRRVHAVLPEEGQVASLRFGAVGLDVLHLHHGRDRKPPVENLGFVVTLGGLRFLHFGDTEAKRDEFEPYIPRLQEVDVALLPFWFLTSSWRAEMVRDELRPRSIVVLHLPLADAPTSYFGRWKSYEETVSLIRSAFPDAIVPGAAGERHVLPPSSR